MNKKILILSALVLFWITGFSQKNYNPGFYSAGAVGTLSLTTSFQTITTGQTNESDIVVLSITNESGNASTVTFADASGNIIGSINLPANAGQNSTSPPVNAMQPGFGMAGLEANPYGGYIFFLPAGIIIQGKVDSVTGGARRVYWKRKDY